jgi:tetratricopeptide (TPR) repeat protein
MKVTVFVLVLIVATGCIVKRERTMEELKSDLSESLYNGDTIAALTMLEQFNRENPDNTETQAALVVLKTNARIISVEEGSLQLMDLRARDSSNFFTDQVDSAAADEPTLTPDQRLEAVEKQIEEDPSDFWNHLEKGRALIDLKRYDEAINSFNKAIELEPENRYPYADRALARYLKGDKEQACKEWESSGGGGLSYRDKYCK